MVPTLWIQPAAGDAGGAVGAAYAVWHIGRTRPGCRCCPDGWAMRTWARPMDGARSRRSRSSTARSFSVMTISRPCAGYGLASGRIEGDRLVPGADGVRAARACATEASWATRADPQMQKTINLKTKFREGFRPFAPVVIETKRARATSISTAPSPYMLLVAPVAASLRRPAAGRRIMRMPLVRAALLFSARLAGHHPHRLFARGCRPSPRTPIRPVHALLTAFRELTGSRCPDQHQLQCARRTDRLHAG